MRPAFRAERTHFYTTITLALLLIAVKAPQESQAGFVGQVVKTYIEETAASISAIPHIETASQLADINSLVAVNAIVEKGRGGTQNDLELSTVQGNSVLAYEPASTDYLDGPGFRSNKIIEYTVQAGDLISFIASDFGVSVDSILWANNIKSPENIQIGQVLRIPPITGIIHKVKAGDGIDAIAKKYGADSQKILGFNEIPAGGQIAEGEELIIPDGRIIAQAPVQRNQITVSSSAKPSKRFAHLPDLGQYFFKPAGGFNWGIIHGRNGIDVANSCGTNIFAAADGTVVLADGQGWNGGFGKYVKIVHPNSTESLYAHLSKISVLNGEFVSRGQTIGLMGTTGRSTGCHIHFEVHGARNPLAKYR